MPRQGPAEGLGRQAPAKSLGRSAAQKEARVRKDKLCGQTLLPEIRTLLPGSATKPFWSRRGRTACLPDLPDTSGPPGRRPGPPNPAGPPRRTVWPASGTRHPRRTRRPSPAAARHGPVQGSGTARTEEARTPAQFMKQGEVVSSRPRPPGDPRRPMGAPRHNQPAWGPARPVGARAARVIPPRAHLAGAATRREGPGAPRRASVVGLPAGVRFASGIGWGLTLSTLRRPLGSRPLPLHRRRVIMAGREQSEVRRLARTAPSDKNSHGAHPTCLDGKRKAV